MGIDITFKSNLPAVMKAIDKAAKDRMEEAVQAVRTQVLDTLSGQRSGRTYRVPGQKRTYTASAPGQPPAVATSDLFKSIKTLVESEGKTVVGYVGTDKIQGEMLEFGTRGRASGKGKILPRPWLRISFEKTLPKIKEIFMRIWF